MQTVQEERSPAQEELEKNYIPPAKKPVYSFFKRFFDIFLCKMSR